MRALIAPLLALAALSAAPLAAQLALPPVSGVLDVPRGIARGALDPLAGPVAELAGQTAQLAQARVERLRNLVRRNIDLIEVDANGDPARRGELVLLAPTEEAIARLRASGFEVIGEDTLEQLGLKLVRIGVPAGFALRKAQARVASLVPGTEVTADTLSFQSGRAEGTAAPALASGPVAAIATKVGVIDGAPGPSAGIAEQRGFAKGAPVGSLHGSAVVSLLQLAGVRSIAVADVYGTDPAGGNALAIARALDWLIGRGSRVVSISLIGPANPLLDRAIAAARARGIVIVAAVGNDGPAAPPSYPASYPGVLAVTGVDGRNRPLIEAGRALHLDYAAPGADMVALDADGRWVRVRGTSFAAPLAAARAASVVATGGSVIPLLDQEAVRLGQGKRAQLYGRGLLCGACRRVR